MTKGKRAHGFLILLTGIGCTVSLASLALAAEITRDEYKAAVEPICKRNIEANKRILKGIRQEVKAGKLRSAGARFAKAATALDQTRRELNAVPKPEADVARLTKWLGYIKSEGGYLREAAKVLKAGEGRKLPRIQILLEKYIRLANSVVLPFDFNYCQSKPASSYT